MLKIAFDPIYAHPLPPGHRFPMLKYELIPGQLLHEGVITQSNLFSPVSVDEENILLTHDANYWQQLRDLTLSSKEQRRIGFPLSAQLVEREVRIAQGTIDGCLYAFEYGVAFNAAGGTHHAGTNWGEGFCMLNDQAIAANYLLNNNLAKRILIVDLDVHQGNGTAQIFKDEPRVFTFSMHGDKNFPFRKERSDLDLSLADGIGDNEYLNLLSSTLPGLITNHQPDLIFYLAGVDILESDKLGKLALSKDACKQRDLFVFEQCKSNNIPVQVSMGGGYSPQIKDIVEAHCNTYRAANDLYF
ncbi:histone deacetylase family protein [Mucilaginibacter phyllosphaerae]|uniref:Acetoin utilization deacetylase AcuC-like enzyme n=1 Tax=Mucilaginibacter phyllosphaerae TaxID=1812349 RepID=A0A4Y8A8N1_9SPHI|nr:histone deacetylase [Mucilaginibacter phyllosphaerae]MBB3970913.1 acetoin utilization deacetylase AcuC-like enzyme [Mucilaginibacter phyllosphaerae]TEW64153.1 histone deacetylase [Mucilaginibacter phyllosphaerae]GGH05399.1 histone deacetylase [Mucilaginibacter phyllosphaerae]